MSAHSYTRIHVHPQLSILVHPDKNEDDKERAQKAFDGEWLVERAFLGSSYSVARSFGNHFAVKWLFQRLFARRK